MDNNQFGLGWKPELEGLHAEAIAANALSTGSLLCSLSESEIPANLDPTWFVQKNQGCWPFCHAHMREGIVKVLYWLSTKGQVQDFSRYYAAITDMRMDGNDSQPEGASIGGSLNASIKYGEPLESLMPYPPLQPDNPGPGFNYDRWCAQHYSNKIAEGVQEDANQRHIKSLVPGIRSYSQLMNALTSGRTAIGIGITWTSGWAQIRGVDVVHHLPSGRILGGHALFLFGWRTIGGEKYPLMHNSHDGWGINRRAALSPSCIDDMLNRNGFGCIAATNIELTEKVPQAQPWDWITPDSFESKPIDPWSGS